MITLPATGTLRVRDDRTDRVLGTYTLTGLNIAMAGWQAPGPVPDDPGPMWLRLDVVPTPDGMDWLHQEHWLGGGIHPFDLVSAGGDAVRVDAQVARCSSDDLPATPIELWTIGELTPIAAEE